jgi:replicative DNA helicase
MADIELELLSRAIMTGGIDQLIAGDIEARDFYDPFAREVFRTCAEHYAIWRHPLSLDGVKRHHPEYQVVPVSDDLGYLISEFRIDRGVKVGLRATRELHKLLEAAENRNHPDHKAARQHFIDRYMEIARTVSAEAPGENVERLSDMEERIKIIRAQQKEGIMPGVPTGIPGLDTDVRRVNYGEFLVHTGFSGTGKTQSLIRSSIPPYKEGDVVLMNSLEMSAPEIWEIYDAEAARLSRRAIRYRELGESDYELYEEAAARVRNARNDIYYVRVETVDKLAAMVERYGAKTVCVDYISLMESQRRAKADWERVMDVSKSLKRLAGDMNIRVYAAAQNHKDAVTDGPTKDNLSYSSAIFYDCNVMVGWWQTPDMARMNQIQGRLIKNRGGELGPPGDSGYYEFLEHIDRDRMVWEPWTDAHKWRYQPAS